MLSLLVASWFICASPAAFAPENKDADRRAITLFSNRVETAGQITVLRNGEHLLVGDAIIETSTGRVSQRGVPTVEDLAVVSQSPDGQFLMTKGRKVVVVTDFLSGNVHFDTRLRENRVIDAAFIPETDSLIVLEAVSSPSKDSLESEDVVFVPSVVDVTGRTTALPLHAQATESIYPFSAKHYLYLTEDNILYSRTNINTSHPDDSQLLSGVQQVVVSPRGGSALIECSNGLYWYTTRSDRIELITSTYRKFGYSRDGGYFFVHDVLSSSVTLFESNDLSRLQDIPCHDDVLVLAERDRVVSISPDGTGTYVPMGHPLGVFSFDVGESVGSACLAPSSPEMFYVSNESNILRSINLLAPVAGATDIRSLDRPGYISTRILKHITSTSDNGSQLAAISPVHDPLVSFDIRPDWSGVSIQHDSTTISLYGLPRWNLIRTQKFQTPVLSQRFLQNGSMLATLESSGRLSLWDQSGGQISTRLVDIDNFPPISAAESGSRIALQLGVLSVFLPNLSTLKGETTIWSIYGRISCTALSSTGQTLYIATDSQTLTAYDVQAMEQRFQVNLPVQISGLLSLSRGRGLLASSPDGRSYLIDPQSGTVKQKWTGVGSAVSALFAPNSQNVVLLTSHGARVHSFPDGTLLATLILDADGSWTVTSPDGRFDSSHGAASDQLHWVVTDFNLGVRETISLSQFSSIFFEPDLLLKAIRGLELGAVPDISALELAPELGEISIVNGRLKTTLTDRGGGIGDVIVRVNNQEIYRSVGSSTVELDIAPDLQGRSEAVVQVQASNAEGSMRSRSESVRIPRAPADVDRSPSLFVGLIIGVERYAGEHLQLRFASDDALAVSKASLALASGLTDVEAKLFLLASDPGESRELASAATILPPSRANIALAMGQIDELQLTDNDLLLVFLAGHGVALGTDSPKFHFLTEEARSASPSVLSSEAIRRQCTISGDELVAWLRRIKAGKRLMILDTCAAGAFESQASSLTRASGDEQSRAMLDFQSRTGLYVLMGAPADLESYEAGDLQHGLMTYSLLYNLSKGNLGSESEPDAVYVNRLFDSVVMKTPFLAQERGRRQNPRFLNPEGTPFPLGFLSSAARQAIPLPSRLPILIRPELTNLVARRDDLRLSRALGSALRQRASLSSRPGYPKAFFDYSERDDAEGFHIVGNYSHGSGKITVKLQLMKDDSLVHDFGSFDFTSTDDLVSGVIEMVSQFFRTFSESSA